MYAKALNKAVDNLELKLSAIKLKQVRKMSAQTQVLDEYREISEKLVHYKARITKQSVDKNLGHPVLQTER